MYLKRKIDTELHAWKADKQRKPLIVKGARQIGKTESIRTFARANYQNVIEINFVEEPKYKAITTNGYSSDEIIKSISRLDPSKVFDRPETLIFFDELQEFPDIATSLKFFAQDGRFDVICSGSMLGINYRQIESVSVGYKTDMVLHSLDFEEFLWAKGYAKDIADELLVHMLELKPFNELDQQLFEELFTDYCTLGGMPEVVSRHVEKGTFEGSLQLQRQLVADYAEDIQKYVEGVDKTRVLNVYNHIPVQLARENKKFQISKVAKGARFKDYRGCAEWLEVAGMVNVCRCMSFPELPLKGNYDEDKFKLYFADTGMLVGMLDDEAQTDLRANRNLGVYKGALYENAIGEALVKQGYGLYYYRRENSTLEQDFFIRSTNELLPIEVKAKDGRSKSLSTLVISERYPDIRHGIRLKRGNVGLSGQIYSFPHFCAFLLKRWVREWSERPGD